MCECVLKFCEGDFCEDARKGGGVGRLAVFESEGLLQEVPMMCCPALDVSDVGFSGEETEEGDDDDSGEGNVGTLFGSRIVELIEGVGELFESDAGHDFFRESEDVVKILRFCRANVAKKLAIFGKKQKKIRKLSILPRIPKFIKKRNLQFH